MEVKVRKLPKEELSDKGVFSWPIWEKEVSQFDWHYDSCEHCYFLEGEVRVDTADGSVDLGKGDFVIFPKGLSCTWKIKKAVKKHYQFK
jgi:uncharacterized cupin superfamily protein